MKTILYLSVVGAILAAGGAASYNPLMKYWQERNQPKWRFAEVDEGSIVSVVNSTGEIKPVQSVLIGSFVSGPIKEIFVDFNDEVKAGDLLAKVDPRLVDANVRRDRATLLSRDAEVLRVEAQLKQAQRDKERAISLQEENKDYISQTEVDQYVYNVESLEAQLEVAKCAVSQAQAALDNSEANLKYTDIIAPIDGVVIDRKIDPGQTLAASFQTPELFVIAPDMEKKMHVFASVDEADIGLIMQAKEAGLPVQFTVDAWPGEVFDGEIEQIRVSSTATQNVVTYPVVVAAPNPERKLLPGMTANITFDVEQRDRVTRVPTRALWYLPQDRTLVIPEDHALLEGRGDRSDEEKYAENQLSAAEKAAAKRNRRERHVWILEDDLLRAIKVTTGISDNKYTELVSGELDVGDKVVVGVDPKK